MTTPRSIRLAQTVLVPAALGLVACSGSETPAPEPVQDDDIVLASNAPPPISGGTLVIAKDGYTAVAADTDRDVVWIVDVLQRKLLGQVPLRPGDEPGRVVLDEGGRAHVVLRAAGAISTIDLATSKEIARRSVCASPRGIAYDPSFEDQQVLHVTCVGGQLVTLPVVGDSPLRKLTLDGDLRDVLVEGDTLFVSRFRSAELLRIGADGPIEDRVAPAYVDGQVKFAPDVAWRTLQLPNGDVAMLHQRAVDSVVDVSFGGAYENGKCSGGAVVHATISVFNGTSAPLVGAYLPFAGVAVDFAVSADGNAFAVVSAATNQVLRLLRSDFETGQLCGFGDYLTRVQGQEVPGQPVAIAYDGNGRIVVQSREPAALYVLPDSLPVQGAVSPIELPGESRLDTGHQMFHSSFGQNSILACASCHVEGAEDGRVWEFDPMGMRRTQNLRGHIIDTAPFHWDGKLNDMTALVADTLTNRMGGAEQEPNRVAALSRWVDSMPPVPSATLADLAAADRGRELFVNKAGCATCHSGSAFTNNDTVDVGTGGIFQVPGLVNVSLRAPYMHNGCAATLRDRFDPACGGSKHGNVADLTSAEIDDLVAFLTTL